MAKPKVQVQFDDIRLSEGKVKIESASLATALIQTKDEALTLLDNAIGTKPDLQTISIDEKGRVVIGDDSFNEAVANKKQQFMQNAQIGTQDINININPVCGLGC